MTEKEYRYDPQPEICPKCGTYLNGVLAKRHHYEEVHGRHGERVSQKEAEEGEGTGGV